MIRFILAPDSFKESLSSIEVCEVIKDAILSVLPEANIISIPMADGGEGTVESIISASNGTYINLKVQGPLGELVDARYGVIKNSKQAIVEMASASGLELVPKQKRNPLLTSTYGTGEIIKSILESGIKDIIIGIGGSATVDAGVGMAQALGYRFLDKNNKELFGNGGNLSKIVSIDSSKAHSLLKDVNIRVACDVKNPLIGETGAARVFAPQKGASLKMVQSLEKGLENIQKIWLKSNLLSSRVQGDGAAGGLGAGLRAFCNAKIVSGAKLIAEVTDLRDRAMNVDYIFTGEGRTDSQTFSGKLCSVVAEIGEEIGVPVILLSGSLEKDPIPFSKGLKAAFSISNTPENLEDAIKNTALNLELTTKNVLRLLKLKNI